MFCRPALTVLMKNVPKQMGQYLGEVLGPVWQTLTSSADTYVNTTVNAREDADDPVDSDGMFDSVVYTYICLMVNIARRLFSCTFFI